MSFIALACDICYTSKYKECFLVQINEYSTWCTVSEWSVSNRVSSFAYFCQSRSEHISLKICMISQWESTGHKSRSQKSGIQVLNSVQRLGVWCKIQACWMKLQRWNLKQEKKSIYHRAYKLFIPADLTSKYFSHSIGFSFLQNIWSATSDPKTSLQLVREAF